MAVIEHGNIVETDHPSGTKGVHVIQRFPAVVDEAARALVVVAAADVGGAIQQTAGTVPGFYVANAAGTGLGFWDGPIGGGGAVSSVFTRTGAVVAAQDDYTHGQLLAASVTPDQHHNQSHAIGGADHTASTLANLNTKVSDATLDDSGDPRNDPDAIHDDVAGEIDAITNKAAPVAADRLLIEDSADSFNKKEIQIGDLPAPAASENAILQMRRTTTLAFPASWADITFNTTDEETDAAVLEHDDVNTERLVFKRAGNYRISYGVAFDQPTNDTQAFRVQLNGAGGALPGSDTDIFDGTALDHTNINRTFLLEVDNDDDYITLQLQNPGTGGTLAVNAILTANALTGMTGAAGPMGGTALPMFTIAADDMRSAINSDAAVNANAPAAADSNNASLTVRLHDDTVEEGSLTAPFMVPSGATNMLVTLVSRAETGAGGGPFTVKTLLYERAMPDNAAVTAWSSSIALDDISIPTSNELFQYDTTTKTLAAWGLTAGDVHQLQITRTATGDTLAGDWDLLEVILEFT